MFRRIKTIVFALLGVAAIATTTAFSVWRYDYVTDQTEMNSANGIDDIKENYSFGAEKPQYKQYTIYLFPSSAYGDPMILNSYMDTMGITNKDDRDHYLVHPEELFGVLTPVLDDNNLPIYGTDRSIKTKKQVFDKSQNKWVDTTEATGTYDDDYIKATLALDDKEANGGTSWKTTYLDEKGPQAGTKIDSTPFSPNELNEIKNKKLFREQVYSCKNYEQVKALVWNENNEDHGGLVAGPYKKDWRFQGRLPKREQRFGYWSKIKEGEGQYLPEKLIINGSISPTLFKDITFKPFTSMGDANAWYNFTFSNWSYDSSLNAGTPYKPGIKNRCLSLDAFSVNDLDSVFDVSKNLSMFSDTNGVIRLYPSFSNGKNYDALRKGENNAKEDAPQYGGRDAIKLNYKFNPLVENYAEKNKIPLPFETYFSYSADSMPNGSTINNGLESMFYATANNIVLMDGLYDSLTISTAWANGSKGWPTGWYDNFTYSNDTLVKNIISQFGQGAYNIYAFIGNSAHRDIDLLTSGWHDYIYEDDWLDAEKRWVNKPIDSKIATKATDTAIGFDKLKNKNIYDMNDDKNICSTFIDDHKNIEIWVGHGFSAHYETRTYQHRPIHICFEKIADYSLYKDLNFRDPVKTKEVIDGKPVYTSTTEWPEIEQEIKNKKPSSQSLVNASNLYFGTGDTNEDFKPDANNSKIDDLTAYAYYIKNVDFTDSFNSFFQIRASEEYIDLNFNENPGDKNYPDANKYAGKNVAFMSPVTPENPESKALDVYLPGYNNPFIDYVKIRTKNKDGVLEERNMFKLKSEEDKGIYDFVFIKYKNTNNFFMYIHRHRNIFVKVLTERVAQYKEEILGPDNKGTGEYTVYAEHDIDKLAPTNEQIWESDFYIGEALKTNKKDKNQVTFEQRILDYMNKKNVTSASLVDHVTGLPVCFFTKEADGTIKTHTQNSQSRDAPILKILKNYILYITPGIYVSEQAIQV